MPGMGDWLNELSTRIALPTGERGFTYNDPPPVPAVPPVAPVTPPLAGAPPIVETPAPTPETPAPAPETPTSTPTSTAGTDPVSPVLRSWLQQYHSGYNVLPPEMFNMFNGDAILREIQKFDPNARWTQTAQYGGEGGDGPMGYRLDYDVTKLPTVGGPGGGRSIFETGYVPVQDGATLLHPEMTYDDPYYGKITPAQNVKKASDPWWTYAAPIAVGMVAPWAAGALAASGIGGAAGLTAGVTGSGLTSGASSWWSNLLAKAPSTAKQLASGTFNPGAFAAGVGANALGIPSELSQPAISAGSALLARPKFAGYDPGAYNSAGSAKKPGSGDSQLVANDFAADPYGFSKGTA